MIDKKAFLETACRKSRCRHAEKKGQTQNTHLHLHLHDVYHAYVGTVRRVAHTIEHSARFSGTYDCSHTHLSDSWEPSARSNESSGLRHHYSLLCL
jgi:hypothetical protein